MKWLLRNWKRIGVLLGGLSAIFGIKPPETVMEAATVVGAFVAGVAIPSGKTNP